MGKTLEDKKEAVTQLKHLLSESQLALVIDYKGLTVAEITDLRKRLRAQDTVCKVTKNTLMRIAVDGDERWQPLTEFLSDSSAFLLVKENMGGAIKAYQDFQKVTKKTELRGGVFEGQALREADIKAISDLPSKDQLMAQVAGAINGVTTKIALGVKEVPGSLARAIKAISEQEAA
ncbi:MAG: 50S ribosomal protein L10 [Synechococcales bacterium]|nr:50S ribosomal protein L10 [Cyanobacteria bacterium REEB444]MEB3125129.1 50S ribosomal protein L10 [Synechococcales bacterium]